MLRNLRNSLSRRVSPYLGAHLKRLWDIPYLNLNALRGKYYIPHPRERIYIETSGVCNLMCRFCAYSKKELAKVIMPLETFQGIVNQATDLGFSRFGLTPLTGEVFIDKTFLEKARFLDGHPGVESYHFYTNFVAPTEEAIRSLPDLKKLHFMHVSLYGHDRETFSALTQRPASQYERLVSNLELLCRLYGPKAPFELRMNWRTTPEFQEGDSASSRLKQVVDRIQEKNNIKSKAIRIYNNWGGIISDDDVAAVGLKVNDGTYVYKKGPCALIFYRICVLADGRVNACACRDVNGSLVIGNLNDQSLAHVLSSENPEYVNLIEEQLRNEFREACRTCDFYQSVHRKTKTAARNSKMRYVGLEGFRNLVKSSSTNSRSGTSPSTPGRQPTQDLGQLGSVPAEGESLGDRLNSRSS